MINSQQALLELIERVSEEAGMPGLEGLENLPEHLLLEELEMLEGITSCNNVDNYLMLDEYEQNLIKEGENPGARGRLRKWSLARQPSQGGEVAGRERRVGLPLGGMVSHPPGLILPAGGAVSKRVITTIGEEEER